MSRIKKYAMAGGTFTAALGVGFVMQNGDAMASRFVETDMAETAIVQPEQIASQGADGPAMMAPMTEELLVAAAIPSELISPEQADAPVLLAALDGVTTGSNEIMTDALPMQSGADCGPTMALRAQNAAMVDIAISAPCQPQTMVTLHHQGMIFTVLTDDNGDANVLAPSLAEIAVFIAAFPNGEGAMGSVSTPDINNYDRAVLQWQGAAGMQLHALEFGADYGSEGHVWAASARDMTSTNPDEGFLIGLGEGPVEAAYFIEAYTFPTGSASRDGNVAISVEAEVTAANCGREIFAQSIQLFPQGENEALDLTINMPECDAVGDFLVLNNMLKGLTLAAK